MESKPFKAHMTVAEAMLRDKYVSNHKFEEDPTYSEFVHEVESFFTQRPNLESFKIKRFLEWVVQNQEIFEKESGGMGREKQTFFKKFLRLPTLSMLLR